MELLWDTERPLTTRENDTATDLLLFTSDYVAEVVTRENEWPASFGGCPWEGQRKPKQMC